MQSNGMRTVNFTPPWDDSPIDISFIKIEFQKKYFEEIRDHLRSIGVKIPVAGTNWNSAGSSQLRANLTMDFTDSHTYWNDWSWSVNHKAFRNASFLGSPETWLDTFPFFRTADRPFFVSEWDDPWPNQYRAEGPLHMASCCAFQGWGGAAIHTYRYDNRPHIDMIAAPTTGEALADVPYRSGIYDSFNDPCRFSLFYHAALMVRRKDIHTPEELTVVPVEELMISEAEKFSKEASQCLALKATDGAVSGGMKNGVDAPSFVYSFPALFGAPEFAPTATYLAGMKLPPNAKKVDPYKYQVARTAEKFTSITGELSRDLRKKVAFIDSPRTKGAYGFLGAYGEVNLKGVKIRCRNEYAVIIMSSLTDDPIATSDNILLTVIGNCDNMGASYNGTHTLQFSRGHGPIEAEVIEAEIEIENATGIFRVDSIGDNGMQIGSALPVTENGKISFKTGGEYPSIHYLIQKI